MNNLYHLPQQLLTLILLLSFAAAFAAPAGPVYFVAEKTGGEVELSWEAPASVSHYTIQRSTDGVKFEIIAKGMTVNTSTVCLTQSVVDPHSGSSSFYRLDIEADSKYQSKTLFVAEDLQGTLKLSVFPNPVAPGQHMNVRLKNVPDGQDVSLIIMDILGKEISTQWISAVDAHKNQMIQVPSTVSQGNYFLIARSRNGIYKHTIKIVIRKGGGF